jgi:hypothetical protein
LVFKTLTRLQYVRLIYRAGTFKQDCHAPNGCGQTGDTTMFTKIIIAFCAVLTLATSLVSTANAQTRQQAVQPFTQGERLWFLHAEGRDDHLPR